MSKGPRLYARWSKRERALVYGTDLMANGGAHGGLLADLFERVQTSQGTPLVKELEARGFDLSTLRFQVRLKSPTS